MERKRRALTKHVGSEDIRRVVNDYDFICRHSAQDIVMHVPVAPQRVLTDAHSLMHDCNVELGIAALKQKLSQVPIFQQ